MPLCNCTAARISETAWRAGAKGSRGSGVVGLTYHCWLPAMGLIGPAKNKFQLMWGSGDLLREGGSSDSTSMGPAGDRIVPRSDGLGDTTIGRP